MTQSPHTRRSDERALDQELNAAARAILVTAVLIVTIPAGAIALLVWALAA